MRQGQAGSGADPPNAEAERPRKPDEQLSTALRAALGEGDEAVVWTDCGDELAVYAGAAQVRRERDALLAEIPVATHQTGRSVLVVPFVLGEVDDDLRVVTSDHPWGDQRLAQRWGALLQDLAWAAIAACLEDAAERKAAGKAER